MMDADIARILQQSTSVSVNKGISNNLLKVCKVLNLEDFDFSNQLYSYFSYQQKEEDPKLRSRKKNRLRSSRSWNSTNSWHKCLLCNKRSRTSSNRSVLLTTCGSKFKPCLIMELLSILQTVVLKQLLMSTSKKASRARSLSRPREDQLLKTTLTESMLILTGWNSWMMKAEQLMVIPSI